MVSGKTTMSSTEHKNRQAQAIVREAILSTDVILYDAYGNPISSKSDQPRDPELEKIREEIYQIVDEHLAKIDHEDLKDSKKLVPAFLQSLGKEKTTKYVFDVLKGELSVPISNGTRVGLKYTFPVYKILAGLVTVGSFNLSAWLRKVEHDRNSAVVFHLRGDELYKEGEFDEALKNYSEAIRVDPYDANAFLMRGNIRYRAGDLKSAERDYTQAIHLNPENGDAFYNRGIARWVARKTKEDLAEVLLDFDETIRLNQQDVGALGFRGYVRHFAGNSDGALEDFDEAIRLDPNYSYALYWRGMIRFGAGDLDAALHDFSECVRVEPSVSFYRERAMVLSRMGDVEASRKDMMSAVELVREQREEGYSSPPQIWLSSEERISYETNSLEPRVAFAVR
jgi:tetratricopeptide (TPR) repeat protein